jgi:hypothetical protein
MGSAILNHVIVTDQPVDQVFEATRRSLDLLGGLTTPTSTGFWVVQGVQGASFGFTSNTTADIQVRQLDARRYEVVARVNWQASAVVIVCMIVGFFVFGILWLVGLFYLLYNPTVIYQQALQRIETFLPGYCPPGAFGAPAVEPGATWYVDRAGTRYGPVTLAVLQQWFASGYLAPSDLVWGGELQPTWAPASQVRALSTPPQAVAGPSA